MAQIWKLGKVIDISWLMKFHGVKGFMNELLMYRAKDKYFPGVPQAIALTIQNRWRGCEELGQVFEDLQLRCHDDKTRNPLGCSWVLHWWKKEYQLLTRNQYVQQLGSSGGYSVIRVKMHGQQAEAGKWVCEESKWEQNFGKLRSINWESIQEPVFECLKYNIQLSKVQRGREIEEREEIKKKRVNAHACDASMTPNTGQVMLTCVHRKIT